MTQYVLHCVTRSPEHRTHRALQATHQKKKHYIGGDQLRLIAGRPLVIEEGVLLRNLGEIKARATDKVLEVRTIDGRLVDLTTLTPASSPAPVIQPHPKLDSLADDAPTGMYIPPQLSDDGGVPCVLGEGEKPALIANEEMRISLEEEAAVRIEAVHALPLDDHALEAALDAAIDAAQAEEVAEGAEAPAPPTQEQVPYGGRKAHRRNRR